jgi:hypothetical protein
MSGSNHPALAITCRRRTRPARPPTISAHLHFQRGNRASMRYVWAVGWFPREVSSGVNTIPEVHVIVIRRSVIGESGTLHWYHHAGKGSLGRCVVPAGLVGRRANNMIDAPSRRRSRIPAYDHLSLPPFLLSRETLRCSERMAFARSNGFQLS